MDKFHQHHIRTANCVKDGWRYLIVLDVEASNRSNVQDKYFWHERELEKGRVSRIEMDDRKRYSCRSRGRNNYWGDRREEKGHGLIEGAVASIQMSAVDVHSFAVNCLSLASSSRDGLPDFPPSFEQLITDPNVIIINMEAFNDIDGFVRSFFRKSVDGISYIEAASFFDVTWGIEYRGSQPTQTPSLLRVIETAFPGETMNKNPRLTCDDWLNCKWSPAMVCYALEDVQFLAEAIHVEMSKRSFLPSCLNDLIYNFPVKASPSKSRSEKSKKRGKFEFRSDDSDDDDENDLSKIMAPVTKKQREEQDEARKKAIVEDLPFIRLRAQAAAEDAATAAASSLAAEKAAAASTAEEPEEVDDCIRSYAYDSIADLLEITPAEEETFSKDIDMRRVVWKTLTIPDDSYQEMEVVSNLPEEEERAMQTLYESDKDDMRHIPSPPTALPVEQETLNDVVNRLFTAEPSQAESLPESVTETIENPNLGKFVETAKTIGHKTRKQIYTIKQKINNGDGKDKVSLYHDVNRAFLPEVLAETTASLEYSRAANLNVRAVMAHWSTSFSQQEKQWFISAAANYAEFADVAEWMEMLKYNQFDLMMIINHRSQDVTPDRFLDKL